MMENLGVMVQNHCDVYGQDPNHCKMWELSHATNCKQALCKQCLNIYQQLCAINSKVGTVYRSGEQSRASIRVN